MNLELHGPFPSSTAACAMRRGAPPAAGAIAWGVVFAVIEPLLLGPRRLRGIEFSIGPWLLMMVLLLPPAGADWFGARLGYGAPLAALVLHIIYGFSLGVIYGSLVPRRGLASAAQGPPVTRSDCRSNPSRGPPRLQSAVKSNDSSVHVFTDDGSCVITTHD